MCKALADIMDSLPEDRGPRDLGSFSHPWKVSPEHRKYILGFDIEKSEDLLVDGEATCAVIQVATKDKIYVFHLTAIMTNLGGVTADLLAELLQVLIFPLCCLVDGGTAQRCLCPRSASSPCLRPRG